MSQVSSIKHQDLKEEKEETSSSSRIQNDRLVRERFISPTWGESDLSRVVNKITVYMGEQPDFSYHVVIGTDSQPNHGNADFVTAIIVHRVGAGGIYFWQRSKIKTYSLRDRIYKEASKSLEMAQKLTEEFSKVGALEFPQLEIHVDVGRKGDTREMIAEVVGMIRGNGFSVKIKPEAYGAATIADRHV